MPFKVVKATFVFVDIKTKQLEEKEILCEFVNVNDPFHITHGRLIYHFFLVHPLRLTYSIINC